MRLNLVLVPKDLWVSDIQHVGYSDVAVSSANSPCIGDDLEGVYFSPALQRRWDLAIEVKFPETLCKCTKNNNASLQCIMHLRDMAKRKSKFIDSFSAQPENPVPTAGEPSCNNISTINNC